MDPFPLDVDLIRKHTYVNDSRDPLNRMKEGVKALQRIEKTIGRIARRVSSSDERNPAGLGTAEKRALLGDRWQERE